MRLKKAPHSSFRMRASRGEESARTKNSFRFSDTPSHARKRSRVKSMGKDKAILF